jgi:hypothetical protein
VREEGYGSIDADPEANCGSDYTSGTSVTLTATAELDYVFEYWEDGDGLVVSYDEEIEVTMTEDITRVAVFTMGA